jgi:hypothetical protein
MSLLPCLEARGRRLCGGRERCHPSRAKRVAQALSNHIFPPSAIHCARVAHALVALSNVLGQSTENLYPTMLITPSGAGAAPLL